MESKSKLKFCICKLCWWNPPSDALTTQYCRNSSLHGLKYIGEHNRHLTERIFWVIAFIAGVVAAVLLISEVWNKYTTNPVIVAFASKDLIISRLPFPAITICNMNMIQKSVALEIQKNTTSEDPQTRDIAQQEINLISPFCDINPNISERYNSNYVNESPTNSQMIDILYKASHPCKEMIQRCSWGPNNFNCLQDFHSTLTESGMCCTFNMMPRNLLMHFPDIFRPEEIERMRTIANSTISEMYAKSVGKDWADWDIKQGYVLEESSKLDWHVPYWQSAAGKSHALSLVLFPDVENYCSVTTPSTGFQVTAHTSLEFPHPHDYGFSVPSGSEFNAKIIPQLTMADAALSETEISSRNCYFLNEHPLKYYKIYTAANCFDECVANRTVKQCKCALYYQPRDNLTRLCGEADFNCYQDAIGGRMGFGVAEEDLCSDCYPLCNELEYRVESSVMRLRNHTIQTSGAHAEDRPLPVWHGKPVTVLNIFYGQRTTVPMVRKKLFGFTDLIASIGGLLGLCLGFTGLSAIEIFYFCTFRLWFHKERVKRRVINTALNFIQNMKKPTMNHNKNTTTTDPVEEFTLEKNKNSNFWGKRGLEIK